MMGTKGGDQDRLFYSFNFDKHIPTDHLLRRIDRFLSCGSVSRPVMHGGTRHVALGTSCASYVPRAGTILAPRRSNRNAGVLLCVKLLERRSHLYSEGI